MEGVFEPFAEMKPENEGNNPPMYLPPDPEEPFLTPVGTFPTIAFIVVLLLYILIKHRQRLHKKL